MKKIILIFIFMSALLVRGQNYIPLLGENKVWSVSHEKFTFSGDTTINDLEYTKLFYHNFIQEFTPDSLEYVAAIREDTINKKVYFIWKDYNTEVLLYDFSLNVGETFHVTSPEFNFGGPHYFEPTVNPRYLEVSMVFDSIVGGKSRKVLKLTGLNNNPPVDYWIQGIGSIYGLIYSVYALMPDKEYPFLLCMHENGQLIYKEDDPYGYYVDTCYAESATYIREEKGENLSIDIYPSNFQDKLYVSGNFPLQEIIVYNLTGKIIYRSHVSDHLSPININTSHWQGGLYIIRAGNSQHFVSKKIVKL